MSEPLELSEEELLDEELPDEVELEELADTASAETFKSSNPHDPRNFELAVLHFEIPRLAGRQRVDTFLTQAVKYATRNRVQKAIAEGRVTVNGKVIKNSYGLMQGDKLEITILRPAAEAMQSEAMELDIRYEDAELIVVNKIAGLAVHPTYRHWTGTLANGLLHHFRTQGDPAAQLKIGLIHRLDKFTSGLIVIGKSDKAKRLLSRQFAERRTRKVYKALVWGVPKQPSGLLETNLGISQRSRMVMDVYPYEGRTGKPARTAWKIVESFGRFSLLEVELFTGRTHQIRAHLRHLGHPILGDFIYGGVSGEGYRFRDQDLWLPELQALIPRQALHAALLGFQHPVNRQWIELEAELPSDMLAAITWLQHQGWASG
ncbi:MAG: RluA family pseudouridine synthase [Candidatus Sericytochromatia bacterium]